MERDNDGLLDGIEDESPGGTLVAFIATVILLEVAALIATVLSRLGVF